MSDDKSPSKSVKKPYQSPELMRWGTMRDITQATGATKSSDGAMKSPNRTSP
jgi:hypothetical protein